MAQDDSNEERKTGLAAFFSALVSPLITVGIALVVTLLTILWDLTPPATYIENMTYDQRLALTAPAAKNDMVIVKMDDASMYAMQDSSACRCFSPVDKVWVGDVVAALSAKGAKAVVLDILFSAWRTEEEHAAFTEKMKDVRIPVIAAIDPALKPGVDFKTVPGLTYASPNALVARDGDVVREYDPKPDGVDSLAAAVMKAEGRKPPAAPFLVRYRAPVQGLAPEDAGAVALSYPADLVAALPDAVFKDKVVFIGRVTRFAPGTSGILEDVHNTPLRFTAGHLDGTPGVEVHAHAFSQMQAGDKVIQPSMTWVALSIFIAGLAGAALGRSTLRWWMAGGLVTFGVLALGAASYFALLQFGVMVKLLGPVTSFGLCFFIQSRLAQSQLQDERKLYATALERYLAPQVIQRIEAGEPMTIGAERREITVMVSDIESFSSVVAVASMEDLASIMNGYFDGLYDVLWKHEAMLDKLTGDGVIVLFGAPFKYADHADRAIACARDITAFSEEYRKEVEVRFGIKMGRTRMGIHTGVCLVGNFGGEKRFNYTAYGQVVVIAARLEAANKETDTVVLFSEDTKNMAKYPLEARPVSEVRLKGVPQPVPTYTVD